MEIVKQIVLIDQILSMLRGFWMDAHPLQKERYMEKIHTALDNRMVLMKARDEQN